MAQTEGVMNTTLMTIWRKVASVYVKVGVAKGASFSWSHSPREISNKDSEAFQEFLEGMRGATAEVSALYAENSAEGYEEWRAALTDTPNRGLVACRYGSGVVGDVQIDFNAYITALESNSGEQEDNVTWSASLQVTGLPIMVALV